jgi:hypothetical protein
MPLTTPALALVAGLVFAAQAGAAEDIAESTDPARVAAVERAAENLKARALFGREVAGPVRGYALEGHAFVAGGITIEDRKELHAEKARYSLWVATVAKPSGAYLSDVNLRIVERGGRGTLMFERVIEGPWLMVALPPGRYDVSGIYRAEPGGAEQVLSQSVNIAQRGQLRQVVLRFETSDQVADEMERPFGGNPFGAGSTSH